MVAQAVFDPACKWRLIEEYGPDSFEEMEDGRLFFTGGFNDRDSLFGWLLSFGSQVELVSPEKDREDFGALIERIAKRYKNDFNDDK